MEWVDKVDWNSWYICLFHCWFQGLSFILAIEQHNEVKDTVLDVTYDELIVSTIDFNFTQVLEQHSEMKDAL